MGSVQRFVIIMLVINLMIGIAGDIYYNPHILRSNQITTEQSIAENYEVDLKKEDGITGLIKARVTQFWDESPLATPFRVAVTVFKIFARGINPFSLTSTQFDNTMEKIMAWSLIWFRSTFWVLLALEIYMFRTNKKAT